MAAQGRQGRARRREGRRSTRSQQAYAGYVYGDSHVRPARGLRARPHRHPGRSTSTTTARPARSALMLGAPGGRGRHGRVRARVGFEQMEKGALGAKCDRPRQPARQARQRDERGAGLQPGAARRADVRRRRPRVPLEVRHQARDLRARSPRRRASTRRRTRTRCSTRRSRVEEILASRRGVRSAHPLPVLPADLRRGRGDPLLRRVREEARHREARSTSPARR